MRVLSKARVFSCLSSRYPATSFRGVHVDGTGGDVVPPHKSWLSKLMTGKGDDGAALTASHASMLSAKDHVYELVTHDTVNGEMGNYLKHYEEYVNVVESKYNKDISLLGSWKVAIGNQDQAIHLWKYNDGYEGVDKFIHGSSGEDKDLSKMVTEQARLCTNRKNALLLKFSFWKEPEPRPAKHIYELRSYVLKPGSMIEWGNSWYKGITYRRDHNQDVGGFFSQIGRLYMVYHLWAYDSLAARQQIRDETWSKPGWDSTVAYTVPLIRNMQSRVLHPNSFSPMK